MTKNVNRTLAARWLVNRWHRRVRSTRQTHTAKIHDFHRQPRFCGYIRGPLWCMERALPEAAWRSMVCRHAYRIKARPRGYRYSIDIQYIGW